MNQSELPLRSISKIASGSVLGRVFHRETEVSPLLVCIECTHQTAKAFPLKNHSFTLGNEEEQKQAQQKHSMQARSEVVPVKA